MLLSGEVLKIVSKRQIVTNYDDTDLSNNVSIGGSMKAVTKKGHREIVECPICRARVAGVIPKGGDGTALRPWKHISALDGYTNPCPGVYELVDFIYHPDLLRKEPQVSGELKPCSICGKPAKQTWDPEENIIKCSDETGYCHNSLYGVYYNEWQSRPIEDALTAKLKKERELSDAFYLLLVDNPNTKLLADKILISVIGEQK